MRVAGNDVTAIVVQVIEATTDETATIDATPSPTTSSSGDPTIPTCRRATL